jgi:hypothetical protein
MQPKFKRPRYLELISYSAMGAALGLSLALVPLVLDARHIFEMIVNSSAPELTMLAFVGRLHSVLQWVRLSPNGSSWSTTADPAKACVCKWRPPIVPASLRSRALASFDGGTSRPCAEGGVRPGVSLLPAGFGRNFVKSSLRLCDELRFRSYDRCENKAPSQKTSGYPHISAIPNTPIPSL